MAVLEDMAARIWKQRSSRMDELPIKARELLREARLAHEPPLSARERMQQRLAAASSSVAPRLVQRDALPSAVETWTRLGLATLLLAILGASRFWLSPEVSPKSQPSETHPVSHEPLLQLEAAPRVVEELAEADSEASRIPSVTSEAQAPRAARRSHRARANDSDDASLVQELNLLKLASDALALRDFARADTLLELHRTRFSNGRLLGERRGLELLRGCLAGAPDARVRAQGYLQAMPHGVLSVRVENACGGLR